MGGQEGGEGSRGGWEAEGGEGSRGGWEAEGVLKQPFRLK